MEKYLRLLLLLTNLSILACASQMIERVDMAKSDPTILAFEEAEAKFQRQLYEDALDAYIYYFKLFPESASADIALKRIATIYGFMGDKTSELKIYQQLADSFPNSPYAPSANFEIMIANHRKNNTQEVISTASNLITKTENKDLLFQTYNILGETYVSLGSPVDAVFFYNLAFKNANSSQKEDIINNLKNIVNLLSRNDLVELSTHLERDSIKGQLLYLIAYMEYERGNLEKAKISFLKYLKKFPNHNNTKRAEDIVKEIDQRTAFRRDLIGCLLPLSGRFQVIGNKALDSIRLALDHYNALNTRKPLQLIIRDTQSNPETVRDLINELDELRVALIIGPMTTSESAAKEAQERKIPILTLSQRPGIPQIGDYVFRHFLTPQMLVENIISCAIHKFGADRFAILYPDEIYGNTFMEIFRNTAESRGVNVVSIASYAPKQTDFSLPIKQLAKIPLSEEAPSPHRKRLKVKTKDKNLEASEPKFDALFIPDGALTAALIAPQLAYWDVDQVLLLGTNLWHSEWLIDNAKDYVQDAIIADAFYENSSSDTVRNFVHKFDVLYGEKPGSIEGLAYDTAMIAFQTTAKPLVYSREDVRDQLAQIRNYRGVTGITSFQSNGENNKDLYVLQIEGSNFVEIN